MQNEAIFYIEKLLNYYNLTSLQELAKKLNIKQSSLSSWKSRNSINAIKNKCREIGIYNEIFGDLNSSTTINQGNNSRAAGNNYNERTNNSNEHNFDTITIGLIEKAIERFGSEEEFQFQLMNFLRDK